MYVFGNLITALASILGFALNAYMWILIARVILSWVNPRPQQPFIQQLVYFIYRITDPLLWWIKRKLPVNFGGLDLSPMIVILIIWFLQSFVVRSLIEAAYRMQ